MEAPIHSRRQIIASLTFATLAILLPFQTGSALARNGNGNGNGGGGNGGGKGGGGGNGSGKGGGGNSGSGSSSGSSNSGNGEGSGGRGRGRGRGNGEADAPGGAKGKGRGATAGGSQQGSETDGTAKSRSSENDFGADSRGLSVRHRNGIAEEVNDRGRYVMRDNRGRTIVNRTATQSDFERLRSFVD